MAGARCPGQRAFTGWAWGELGSGQGTLTVRRRFFTEFSDLDGGVDVEEFARLSSLAARIAGDLPGVIGAATSL